MDRSLIEQCDERGVTPLMGAVICKNSTALRLLIQHGADVNHIDLEGWTAMSWAIFVQNQEAQKILTGAKRAVAISDSPNSSGAMLGTMIRA